MRPSVLPFLIVTFLLAVGCSMPNPLAGIGVSDGTHGGWGPDHKGDAEGEVAPPEEAPAITEAEPARMEREERDIGERSTPTPTPTPTVETPPVEQTGSAPRVAWTADEPANRPVPPTPNETSSAASSNSADAIVSRISVAERSDGRGLVVRIHASGHIPAYRVNEEGDGKVSLSLFQTSATSAQPADPQGPIREMSVEQEGSRAVLRLELDPDVSIVPQAYPDRDSDDLLLALTFAQRPTIATRPTSPVPAGSGNGDGNNGEHWRLDCIVLDAGHGGHDPGAVNRALGIRESDVALAITLRLGRMIEENLGVRVVYTRTDDRFVELEERGRIANQSCGKLFVSIHGNSATNHAAHGTETYFLGMHRTEHARRVMERENSVIALESDPSLYSGMDEAALIMQTMAQATYLRTSELLAGLIEGQFEGHASRRSRGVKQAGFLVLWGASMPAVLVETGFISNPAEARYLNSARGQEQIAESIYRAIREYKEQYERSLGLATR